MSRKFNHLNVPDQWNHYWSRYPQGYTIMESLITWVSQVDAMVDSHNVNQTTINDFGLVLEDFLAQYDTGLRATVETTLSEWQSSGFLNVLIDAALHTEMDNLATTTEQALDYISSQVAEKAEESELLVQKARIDGFTTLAAGSTTGDAELIDGHVGVDGISYPNIGTAIREQITKLTNKSLIMTNQRVTDNTHLYYDANNVPPGKIVAYGGSGLNVPHGSGTLLCFEGARINGLTQLYVTNAGMFYSRVRWSGTWREWHSSDVTSANLKELNALTPYGRTIKDQDLNLMPVNSVYLVTTRVINAPEDTLYGTVITMGGENTPNKSGIVQMYISTSTPTNIYMRLNWSSTWGSWVHLNKTLELPTSNITERDFYASLSLFEEVGVVGDSYASGSSGENPGDTSATDHMSVSWPQMLGRRNGVSVTNYTIGGLSTRSFLTNNEIGMDKLESDTAKGLYILALIRNDYNIESRGETGYIGSIADITNNSLGTYPDTFFGNYATIIERIKNHAPKSAIVMMSGDYKSDNTLGTAYNNAMNEIANHFGLPIMVQLDDPFFSSVFYRQNWPAGGHPSPVMYSGLELAVERMFNKCVNTYKDYFNYYYGVD